MPTLSIVIVVYNDKVNFKTSLESVASLVRPPDEIIVVDNCSTDGSSDVVTNYSSLDVKHIIENDSGIFDAMNKGIRRCTSDYIHILNCGDKYSNPDVFNFLDKLNHNTADFFLFTVKRNRNDGSHWHWEPKSSSLYGGIRVSHAGLIVRTAAYKKFGVYDLAYKFIADAVFILKHVKRDNSTIIQATLVDVSPPGFSSSNSIKNLMEMISLSWLYPTNFLFKSWILILTVSKYFRGVFR